MQTPRSALPLHLPAYTVASWAPELGCPRPITIDTAMPGPCCFHLGGLGSLPEAQRGLMFWPWGFGHWGH